MEGIFFIVCAVLMIVIITMMFMQTKRGSADSGETLLKALREEFRAEREASEKGGRNLREELASGLGRMQETVNKTLESISKLQGSQQETVAQELKSFSKASQEGLSELRDVIDRKMKDIQESTEKKLEEMRKTVDEKLHETLEKRLGESFRLVSSSLEDVQKGLGEMRALATGVGDLKKVLTNVRARGTWGEVQLGALLEQILTVDQFEKNVKTKAGSPDFVEFAIKLPGGKEGGPVWLPVDSKFPQEDYARLLDASDRGDAEGVEKATKGLVRAVQTAAQEVRDKYLDPPKTTDFAILFFPTEGLYSEILRQPGLLEEMQNKYRVIPSGPTTLAATLNSLKMGFQTLAIEARASEVWTVLSAVKTEFHRFGEVLEKVKKQLSTASKTIDETGVRTRAIEKKLSDVEKLPSDKSEAALDLDEVVSGNGAENDQ